MPFFYIKNDSKIGELKINYVNQQIKIYTHLKSHYMLYDPKTLWYKTIPMLVMESIRNYGFEKMGQTYS